MASEVGICNSALIKLGVSSRRLITALTEGTKNANLCNEQYGKLRDAELRKHLWNFAKERVKLSQITGDPVSGFDYRYQLPSDRIRTIAVHDNDADLGTVRYEIKGDRLLSDAPEIWLTYVKQETDPNIMDPLFREVLATRLAAELAIPIASSRTIKADMNAEYRSIKRTARSADSMEDFPQEFPVSPWISARF